MTQLVRIPLAWPIGSRSALSQAKDPYIRNGILEKYGDKLLVKKRPGTNTFLTISPGNGPQGAFYFNGFYYVVDEDVLYRNSGTHSAGTTGATWTQAATPLWPATELQNAIVFKDRIFMIGGVSATTGIWSTQDGLTWAVASSVQPWGYRDQQGLVVFNNQMYILGGLNVTLNTTFNDIWTSSDGSNWKSISDPGVAAWPGRCSHIAIAANNGIYIYSGASVPGAVYYNDAWYSNNGIDWVELTAAAPWTARSNALGLWFNDKLWIIGGTDAANTPLNDVWSSPDGARWTQTTAAAFPSGRFGLYGCVYGGKMWAIGGEIVGSVFMTTVYNSSDGITWTLVTSSPGWTGRAAGAAVVFRVPTTVSPHRYPTMWILGGDHNGTNVQEVWYSNLDSALATSFALLPTTPNQPYQFTTYMNGTKLLIKNQSNFWVLESGTLTKVIDQNYPPITVPGVVVLNAFAYVMTPEGEIHSCKLDDPLTWPSLQFLTADYEDDIGIALAKYLNYVVAFGQYTTQFFYDNGANQPVGTALAPYINANLRMGCTTAASVVTAGNALMFIGQGDTAARQVLTFNGFSPVPVSTPYVDRFLMDQALSGIQSFGMACDGHEYYVLKTGGDTALVYDVTMKEWYEWDNFYYSFYLTNFATDGNYLLASAGGQLVQASPTVYSDAVLGDFTLSCQTDKVDHGNMALKFCGRATLVGDKNLAEPSITYSDDDYQTYTTAGSVNMNSARPFITRLGSFRRRAWRLTQTDNYPARWEALEVEYSQGES